MPMNVNQLFGEMLQIIIL